MSSENNTTGVCFNQSALLPDALGTDYPYHELLGVTSVLAMLFAACLVGNVLFLYICLEKWGNSSTYMFFKTVMAFLHLVKSAIYVPLIIYMTILEVTRQPLTSSICKLYHVVIVFFPILISLVLLLATIDRYIQSKRPWKIHKLLYSMIQSAVVCAIAVAITLPMAVIHGSEVNKVVNCEEEYFDAVVPLLDGCCLFRQYVDVEYQKAINKLILGAFGFITLALCVVSVLSCLQLRVKKGSRRESIATTQSWEMFPARDWSVMFETGADTETDIEPAAAFRRKEWLVRSDTEVTSRRDIPSPKNELFSNVAFAVRKFVYGSSTNIAHHLESATDPVKTGNTKHLIRMPDVDVSMFRGLGGIMRKSIDDRQRNLSSSIDKPEHDRLVAAHGASSVSADIRRHSVSANMRRHSVSSQINLGEVMNSYFLESRSTQNNEDMWGTGSRFNTRPTDEDVTITSETDLAHCQESILPVNSRGFLARLFKYSGDVSGYYSRSRVKKEDESSRRRMATLMRMVARIHHARKKSAKMVHGRSGEAVDMKGESAAGHQSRLTPHQGASLGSKVGRFFKRKTVTPKPLKVSPDVSKPPSLSGVSTTSKVKKDPSLVNDQSSTKQADEKANAEGQTPGDKINTKNAPPADITNLKIKSPNDKQSSSDPPSTSSKRSDDILSGGIETPDDILSSGIETPDDTPSGSKPKQAPNTNKSNNADDKVWGALTSSPSGTKMAVDETESSKPKQAGNAPQDTQPTTSSTDQLSQAHSDPVSAISTDRPPAQLEASPNGTRLFRLLSIAHEATKDMLPMSQSDRLLGSESNSRLWTASQDVTVAKGGSIEPEGSLRQREQSNKRQASDNESNRSEDVGEPGNFADGFFSSFASAIQQPEDHELTERSDLSVQQQGQPLLTLFMEEGVNVDKSTSLFATSRTDLQGEEAELSSLKKTPSHTSEDSRDRVIMFEKIKNLAKICNVRERRSSYRFSVSHHQETHGVMSFSRTFILHTIAILCTLSTFIVPVLVIASQTFPFIEVEWFEYRYSSLIFHVLFMVSDVMFPLSWGFLNLSFRREVRVICSSMFQCKCFLDKGMVRRKRKATRGGFHSNT